MPEALFYYPDPSYIIGRFKKRARELKDKKKRHDRKTSIKLDEYSASKRFKFVISHISEMEIKKALMNEEGLTFEQANIVFNEVASSIPNYVKIVEVVEVTPDVCNIVCRSRLVLGDVLHILIAARLKIFVITKESNLEKWKGVYSFVLSSNQFQEKIKTLQPG